MRSKAQHEAAVAVLLKYKFLAVFSKLEHQRQVLDALEKYVNTGNTKLFKDMMPVPANYRYVTHLVKASEGDIANASMVKLDRDLNALWAEIQSKVSAIEPLKPVEVIHKYLNEWADDSPGHDWSDHYSDELVAALDDEGYVIDPGKVMHVLICQVTGGHTSFSPTSVNRLSFANSLGNTCVRKK